MGPGYGRGHAGPADDYEDGRDDDQPAPVHP